MMTSDSVLLKDSVITITGNNINEEKQTQFLTAVVSAESTQ